MAEQQSIQSVDAAMRLLQVLAATNRAMTLKEISAAVGMTASNNHRYMVSFMRASLVCQESDSGRYDLGPFALHLGLAAMGRLDPVTVATKLMMELRARIDLAVSLSIWTPDGPTMIRWLDSSHPLTVNIKPGSRTPLLNSASGRVFLSFEPQEKLKTVLAAELRVRRSRKETAWTTMEEVNALRAEVRRHGLGRVRGDRVSGVNGLSAPIFDAAGELALTISTIGLEYAFDASYNGAVAIALRDAAARASAQLGFNAQRHGVLEQRAGDKLQ